MICACCRIEFDPETSDASDPDAYCSAACERGELAEDQQADFGPCCACDATTGAVRNVVMLRQKAPIAGRGWGCVVCGLPNDGALAVLCDACMKAGREPLLACSGYPATDGRVPIAELDGVHEHNMDLHAEDDLEPTKPPPIIYDGFLSWYTEYFDPIDDRCSLCGGIIEEEDVPLILFREVPSAGQTWQARICEACIPIALARLQPARRE